MGEGGGLGGAVPWSRSMNVKTTFTIFISFHLFLLLFSLPFPTRCFSAQLSLQSSDLFLKFPKQSILGILINLGFVLDVLCSVCISEKEQCFVFSTENLIPFSK